MKTLNKLSPILLSTFIVLVSLGSSIYNEYNSETNIKISTFTLSGSITNGSPDLSWNSVPNADEYVVNRYPVSATGYYDDSFEVISTTNFIDQDVEVIEQTGGFCRIRYRVSALDENKTLIETSNTIDFITTPNSEVFETGLCREP